MESSQPDGLVMKLKGQVNDAKDLPLLEGKPCYNGKDSEEEESKPADQDCAVSKENSPPQLSPISPASSSDTVDLAENGLQKCKEKPVSKEENIGTSVENSEMVAKLPIEGTSFITENKNEESSVEKLNNKELTNTDLTNATQNVPTTESSSKNAMDCSGDAPVVKVDSTKELRQTEAPVLDGKVSPINETKDKNTEDTNNLLTASNKIVETSAEKRETADKPEIIPTPMFEDITEDEDSENDESLENIELELDDLIEPLELSKSGCSSDKEKCEFSPNAETDKDVLVLDNNIVKSKILENINQNSVENMGTSSVSDVKSTDTLVSNSETSVKEDVSGKEVLGTTDAVIQENCPDVKEREGKVIQLSDSKAVNGTAGAPQVKKPKVTARKSGKPESVPLKINLHPIKNITMTLSEVEKALDFNPARDLESSKLKSSESSKTNYTSTDTTPLDCSSENSALKNIAGLKKKRRKKTYDFPGCKKKPRKLKSDEMESVGSSADSFSLSDGDFPDTDVNKEASFQDNESASLPKKPESALDILTKNAYLGFTKKPKSSISPSSLSSSTSSKPTSGKSNKIRTVLEMLHERSRQKAESEEKKAASTTLTTLSVTSNSTTTTTTILVSPPHNKPVVEGLKRKGTPRKRREEVICLSDSDDSDAKKNSLVEGKRKRESLDEVSQASSPSPHKPSQHTKNKNVSSTSQSPVVMVVAQHSVAPGLRSLLPRQAPAMSSKSVQPPASNLLNTIPLISTLPMGAKAISIANLPPGVAVPLASLPQGTQQAMTFFAPVPAVTAIPVSFSPGQMSVNSPKHVHATHKTARGGSVPSSPSGKSAKTSLSPSHTSSDSLRALLVGKPYTLARVSSASATQLATSPMLFQMVTTSGASLVPISAQPLTLTPSSSSVGNSMLKPASAVAGSKTSYSLIKSHPSNLPNGVSCLTPPKTPETDSSSEVVVAASLSRPVAGQVEDSEVIPLCCCKINGASFNKLFSGVTYCQALDTVDNKVLGCCNKVTNTQLVRPGVKIPFMAVCEVHRRRLKLHQCCPGCGHFCSQGKFQQCRKEGKSSVHNFHKQCMFYRSGKYYCPHCGEETTQCEVELKLNDQKPEEGKVIPQRVTKRDTERKTARLGFRNFVKSKSTNEQPKETISLSNNKVINIGSLPLGPDHQALSKLCRCTAEDRPKKYRTLPKDLYTPAMEGDLEKVFYLLMDGVDPNKRYEDHDDQTAMHAAAISGSLATVFILEQYGAEIHAQDRTLRTPMMCAAENGNLNVVQFLIKAGAKVEDRGEDGMTSLHYAAKAGYIDIIQHILEADKLDINIQDDGGWTPIIWATESQLADIVRYLLKQGGDPNKKDNEENTGLHWAAFSGSLAIAEMFIDMGCEIDAINEHGDRPLHIAARQDHYDIVVLLLARGADVDTKNNKDETPVDCCLNKSGQVWMALKVNQQLRSFAARKLIQPERLVERDITMGREKNPIACVNSEDSEPCPTDYLYVTENVETSPLNINYVITSLQSCRCKDDCSSMYCVCGRSSIKCWYDKMGHFLEEVNLLEPPLVFECNRACRCWVNCNNRVVQNGITCRLQMFRTNGRGWGVRTLMDIPRGTFVCEYIGELISDSEADRREDDSYLFDLDNKDGDTYCIDARKYGNISRFINHLCEPNLIPVKVFVEHQDLRFPRICLFSSREIKAYEELGFDYGEKFWMIKWKHFTCACKSAKCKYSSETIKKTLADYKLRYPDEVVDV